MKEITAYLFIITLFIASTAQATDLRNMDSLFPVFKWDPWNAAISPDGNIQGLFISFDEREEMDVLLIIGHALEEKRREEHGIEPNNWKTVACFTDKIDMVFVDEDGTRFNEKGGLGPEDKEWVKKNYQQYIDAAYAFSRGTTKLDITERHLKEPLIGEYRGATSFWMDGWSDLGTGLNPYDFDSVTGVWYEGPCRPWSRGAYRGGGGWAKRMGHSNAQFARGREVGGSIGDISKITRHEWGHGVSTFIRKCGYTGLPTQYTPGNYHHGAHLFFFRSVLSPAHWRKMRMQAPKSSPANRPNDRYLGFCSSWLAAGPFDLPESKHSTETGVPHPEALDEVFIDPDIMPDKNMKTTDGKWLELTNDWKRNGPNIRSVFPSPHIDTIVYAHAYVYSPDKREVKLWAGCTQPTDVYLNGAPALRFWRGGYEDGAARKVVLKKGWNRIMYKILDQGENGMGITLRFTDDKHNVLTDLQFSGEKPEDAIVKNAASLPPKEIKKYSWEWPVNDDWYGQLPILGEEDFDEILGVKGVRIVGAPSRWSSRNLPWQERRWTLIDLSNIKGDTQILSRIIPWDSLKTTLESAMTLDNHLVMSRELGNGQRSYESMGLIRYKKADGKTGDLIFLRADVVELFLANARRPKNTPEDFHTKNIVGHILRDTKNYIVLDTDLGGNLPVNELDMLTARDGGMELEASPSVSRVLKGNPASLNLTARWNGDKPIKAVATIKRFDTGETVNKSGLGTMVPGSSKTITQPLDTSNLDGLVSFIASIDFENDGHVEKPIPLPVFDPVSVKLRIEGSGICQVPDQIVTVTLSSNQAKSIAGTVVLDLPDGWKSKSASANFELPALDTSTEVTFKLKLPVGTRNGLYQIGAIAKVSGASVDSSGSLPVLTSLDNVLVEQDFEDGIGGSFSFTDAMYEVNAAVSGPKNGQRCLHITDRGGSHFGHVSMFGPGERPSPIPAGMEYTYDTKLYPWVEFWLKTNEANANIGLQVVLDDGDDGYGVLINGFWEQQWVPRMLIGRAEGFAPDGNWHLVRVNLDKMLDGVLGETSHFVKSLQFGDTRGFASGWAWSFDYYHFYIDNFKIYREETLNKLVHVNTSVESLPRYSKTHRVPAFGSESKNGIKVTLRTNRLEYNPWHKQQLQLWITNTSDKTVSVPIEPWKRLWQVRIKDEDGNVPGGEWAFFGTEEELKKGFKVSESRDLKPGESYYRKIGLQELVGGWMKEKDVKLDSGRKYILEAKIEYKKSEEAEVSKDIVTGPVKSNTMTISMAQVPTFDDELEALNSSLSVIRRARAAAQLGKTKEESAIPALIAALKDTDENVRLNAVWALGNMPRFNMEDDVQKDYREKMAPAVKTLLATLDDKNWRVGEYAAQALANLNAREGLSAILKRTENKSEWIRRRTANALRTMGDAQAVTVLSKLMDDESRSVRQATLSSLIVFANNHFGAAKDENNPNHKDHKVVFDAAWEGISKGLKDEFFVIRRDVVNVSRKYQPLVNAAEITLNALEDPDDWVREAGIRSLPELENKPPEIEERLIDFMDDYWDNIRKAALEVYPKATGETIEEGTGKSFGYWMRKYPRPGDTWR